MSLPIHQIWLQGLEAMPERYNTMRDTWKDLPGYRFWDYESIDRLMVRFPTTKKSYDSLKSVVEKVDLAKYLILFVHGGMYVDMDVIRLAPYETFDHLFGEHDLLAFGHRAGWWDIFYHKLFGMKGRTIANNAVIMVKPGHQVIADVMTEVIQRSQKWYYNILKTHFRTIHTTGPLVYTNVLHKYNIPILEGEDTFEPLSPDDMRIMYSRGKSPMDIASMVHEQDSTLLGVHFMDLNWLIKGGMTSWREKWWEFVSKARRLPRMFRM